MTITFDHFQKVVTAAGTQERLKAAEFFVRKAIICALLSNTNKVYVGGAAVSDSAFGVELNAGDTFPVENTDLYNIWIDTDVNGEGVAILYGR